MSDKYIIDGFENIKTNERYLLKNVKDRIAAGDHAEYKEKKIKKAPRVAILTIIAVFAVGMVMYSVPAFNSFASETIKSIFGYFITDGDKEIKMEEEYIYLNNTKESRKDANYSNIDEIEEMLGIDLLQSTEEYDGAEGIIKYYSTVIGDQLYGAGITTDQYSVGDVKNLKVESDPDDFSSGPTAYFDPGEKYKSTLACEISIMGKRPMDDVMSEFESDNVKWEVPKGSNLVEYKPKNLDATAAIYKMDMDGGTFDSWDMEEFNKPQPAVVAHVHHEGIVYMYLARVSIDTMKDFLDTLYAEPGKYEVTEPSDLSKPTTATPKVNDDGSILLTGNLPFKVGEKEAIKYGKYELTYLSKIGYPYDDYRAMPSYNGLKVHNFELSEEDDGDRYLISDKKNGKVLLSPAKTTKFEKVNGTYRITNTVGVFDIGTEIPAGKYKVRAEFDTNSANDGYLFFAKAYRKNMDRYSDETANYKKYNIGISSPNHGWTGDKSIISLDKDRMLSIEIEKMPKGAKSFTLIFEPIK